MFRLDLQLKFDILLTFTTTYDYKLSNNLLVIGEELRQEVKAKLITQFNHFLLIEYDDGKWIEHFQMSKGHLPRYM